MNTNISRKEQTSPDKYYNSEVGIIRQPFFQPRFNRAVAVSGYTGYWAAALDYNANAAASGIIRFYSRTSKNGLKCRYPTTQHNNIYQRNYFAGKLEDKPSTEVQYKTQNIPEDFELVQGHAVIDLFMRANPIQSTFQFLFQIFLSLEITGDAFVHIVSFTNGTPAQMYVLQSQFMDVIPATQGQGRLVDKYIYKKSLGKPVEYAEDEIIHIKYISPKEDGLFYGMGKIEKGWHTYLLNKFSHEYQIALYSNHAVPDYILINKSGSKINRKRFYRNMRNIAGGGPTNRGKVMAIDGDVSIETVAFKPKDLSDIKFNIQEIAAISGCPLGKLIGNDQVKANSEQQNTSWLRNTIAPMMKLVASTFSENLLKRYNIADGDALLCFDTPVPEDVEQKRKTDETYAKIGVLTGNEIRAELGREPLGEELDEVYFNGNRLGDNKTTPATSIPEKQVKGPDVLDNELKSKLDSIIGDITELNNKKEIKDVTPVIVNINNNVEEDETPEEIVEEIKEVEQLGEELLEKEKGVEQDNTEVIDIETNISTTIANRIKDID